LYVLRFGRPQRYPHRGSAAASDVYTGQAVQHTLYPPDWLDAWPEGAGAGRLVFITRGVGADEVVPRFAAGDPAVLGIDAPGAVPDSPRGGAGGT